MEGKGREGSRVVVEWGMVRSSSGSEEDEWGVWSIEGIIYFVFYFFFLCLCVFLGYCCGVIVGLYCIVWYWVFLFLLCLEDWWCCWCGSLLLMIIIFVVLMYDCYFLLLFLFFLIVFFCCYVFVVGFYELVRIFFYVWGFEDFIIVVVFYVLWDVFGVMYFVECSVGRCGGVMVLWCFRMVSVKLSMLFWYLRWRNFWEFFGFIGLVWRWYL